MALFPNTTTIPATSAGASTLAGLTDVAISSPTNGQVPVYNSGTGKWANGSVSATDISALTSEGYPFNSTVRKMLANNNNTHQRIAVTGIGALAGNATAQSDAIDTSKHTAYQVLLRADQASATNGAKVFGSLNGGTNYSQIFSGALVQATLSANTLNTSMQGTGSGSFMPDLLKVELTNGAVAHSAAPVIYLMGRTGFAQKGLTKTIITPTLLGNGGVYNSPAYDMTRSTSLTFLVQTDKASASNGVVMQHSVDGSTNWIDLASPGALTMTANTINGFSSSINGLHYPFLRLKYTNGTTPQGLFVIVVIKQEDF